MFVIRDPEKIHSGSRILGIKKHHIPDPDMQHWVPGHFFSFNGLQKMFFDVVNLLFYRYRISQDLDPVGPKSLLRNTDTKSIYFL
jgi:hypothetical protein